MYFGISPQVLLLEILRSSVDAQKEIDTQIWVFLWGDSWVSYENSTFVKPCSSGLSDPLRALLLQRVEVQVAPQLSRRGSCGTVKVGRVGWGPGFPCQGSCLSFWGCSGLQQALKVWEKPETGRDGKSWGQHGGRAQPKSTGLVKAAHRTLKM